MPQLQLLAANATQCSRRYADSDKLPGVDMFQAFQVIHYSNLCLSPFNRVVAVCSGRGTDILPAMSRACRACLRIVTLQTIVTPKQGHLKHGHSEFIFLFHDVLSRMALLGPKLEPAATKKLRMAFIRGKRWLKVQLQCAEAMFAVSELTW